MDSALLGIVGWSGSGKTSLLEYVIQGLVKHRMKVNVIKHSHHDVILEPAHKDSARFRSAGAGQVVLASPYRFAIMEELRNSPEPTLHELLTKLDDADITLVEGFKWEAIDKIEVLRPSLGKLPLYPDDPHVVAVASDVARPIDCPSELAWLDLNSPEDVLIWIKQRYITAV
ncbi:molybdopterin-guanine dinucleotide biosynthesis protein B [Undibacterium fentianense]|uniref:Molybdopterin-guanine dinucleotide biosynthesis protein B n=1 Tax=Undibacterium fentianense TaxID=2828728 RepID=A0A941E0M7_9BURK|nr:molybdopterin-guanine dinucleotide biosynthesis protein B [Undibacterium fentianense]MBR7799176.1 molybdopterin-guanine dinucleotide biosynthesis protein B [Undibacterium fentianense]